MKRNKDKVLEEFERLINRDKSNDIIDYNWLKRNKKIYDELMIDFFKSKDKRFV